MSHRLFTIYEDKTVAESLEIQKQTTLKELQKIRELERVIEERLTRSPVAQDNKAVFLTKDNIQRCIEALGRHLMTEIKDPILISVMDADQPFSAALQKNLTENRYTFQYITQRINRHPDLNSIAIEANSALDNVAGRTVVVLDAVCSSGNTFNIFKQHLLDQGAQNVFLMVLLNKEDKRKAPITPDFTGFEIPDIAVAGFGLDDHGFLRNSTNILETRLDLLPTASEELLLKSKSQLTESLRSVIKLLQEPERVMSYHFEASQCLFSYPMPTDEELKSGLAAIL